MTKSILLLLFTVIIGNTYAQDMQIQEPIKNFDQLWNQFNDRYAFFEHKNVDWNTIYKKYRPLLNERTTNDSLFTVCNQMLLELKDGHVSLVQFDGNKVIRESNDGHQNILTKKFPITKDSEPNIFQLVELTNLTLQKKGFSNLIKSESKLLQISESTDYGYLVIAAMEGFKSDEINSFMAKLLNFLRIKKVS